MQDHERDLSCTMVLIDDDSLKLIVGYHTLVMTQVRQEKIPNDRPRITRGIPVILLGQLGVGTRFQGQGIGDLLLMDAQARTDDV